MVCCCPDIIETFSYTYDEELIVRFDKDSGWDYDVSFPLGNIFCEDSHGRVCTYITRIIVNLTKKTMLIYPFNYDYAFDCLSKQYPSIVDILSSYYGFVFDVTYRDSSRG